MVQKIYQHGDFSATYLKYVAETVSDMQDIRVNKANMGSEVYVIETKKTYILDGKGVWHSKVDDETATCNCLHEWNTLGE